MRRYLRPTEGLSIIDPRTKRVMPASGQWVIDDTYWRRRLRDGDCYEEPEPPGAVEAVRPADEPTTAQED